MRRRHAFAAVALALCTQPAGADGFGFMTPSGNIYCNGFISGGGGIDCWVINRQGPPAQPWPGTCQQSWGHAFSLNGTGPARLTCGPKPKPVNYSDIAPYGQSGQFGAITCWSETTGLTCQNASGHGFFLSRRSQRVF